MRNKPKRRKDATQRICNSCEKHCVLNDLPATTLADICELTEAFLKARSNKERVLALSNALHLKAAVIAEQARREYDAETLRLHNHRKLKAEPAEHAPIQLPRDSGIIVLRDDKFDAKAVFFGPEGKAMFMRIDMPGREPYQIDYRLRHVDLQTLIPMKVEPMKTPDRLLAIPEPIVEESERSKKNAA